MKNNKSDYDPERDKVLVEVAVVEVEESKTYLSASITTYLDEEGEPGQLKLSIVRCLPTQKRGVRILPVGRLTEAEAQGLFAALTPAVVAKAFETARGML